ncbi:MAG TPA: hypothetical protein VGF86_13245 [Candidatus Tumulicola sp.]|jgi:hypothetical protein
MRKLSPEEIKQRDAALEGSFRDSLEQVAQEDAAFAKPRRDAMLVTPLGALVGALLGYRAGLQPGGLPVADAIVGAFTGGMFGYLAGGILGIRIHRPPEADLIEQTNARWRKAIFRAFIGGTLLGLIAGYSEGLRYDIVVASTVKRWPLRPSHSLMLACSSEGVAPFWGASSVPFTQRHGGSSVFAALPE